MISSETIWRASCDGCGAQGSSKRTRQEAVEDGAPWEISTLAHLCEECQDCGIAP